LPGPCCPPQQDIAKHCAQSANSTGTAGKNAPAGASLRGRRAHDPCALSWRYRLHLTPSRKAGKILWIVIWRRGARRRVDPCSSPRLELSRLQPTRPQDHVFCARHLLASKLRVASVDAASGAVEEEVARPASIALSTVPDHSPKSHRPIHPSATIIGENGTEVPLFNEIFDRGVRVRLAAVKRRLRFHGSHARIGVSTPPSAHARAGR
jgi:hypothetical protein